MMKKYFYLGIILIGIILLVGCNSGWKTYTIKKGDHFCTPRIVENVSDYTMYFLFKFDPSCLYDVSQTIPGWNKLYGFGDIDNHNNSVRLVWVPLDNKIKIGWYCYVDGVREYAELDTIEVGREYYGMVRWTSGYYQFRCDDQIKSFLQPEKPILFTMKQYPYFGGQSEAPHEMTIMIKDY